MRYCLKGELFAVCALIGSTAAWSTPITFTDNFDRPDGVVGNGWLDTIGNVAGNLVIRSGALSTPTPSGDAGVYRPVDFSAPVTISGVLTQSNGYGIYANRYQSGILFGTNGDLSSGYEVFFSHSDQNYANSSVLLKYNGSVIGNLPSTFQFGTAIAPTITYAPTDGRVSGSVVGDGHTFNFDFGPHTFALPGSNVGIDLEFPDSRGTPIINPTFDSFSVSFSSGSSTPPVPTPPPIHTPINYGLFIGSKDDNNVMTGGSHPLMLFDQNAQTMASTFESRPNSKAYILTGDLTLGADRKPISPISVSQVSDAMEAIKHKMRPGDTFTLYINGHGTSADDVTKYTDGNYKINHVNDDGNGNEAIHIGEFLTDVKLAELLKTFDGFRKTIFLDSCHGGGFWGGSDPLEDISNSYGLGFKQLDLLSNIALYSGAPEFALEYAPYDPFGLGVGLSYWGQALEAALATPVSWSGAGLAEFLDTTTKELADPFRLNYPVYYTLGFGDTVSANPALIQTFEANSSNFDLSAPLFGAVPEPDSLALVGIGIVAFAFRRSSS